MNAKCLPPSTLCLIDERNGTRREVVSTPSRLECDVWLGNCLKGALMVVHSVSELVLSITARHPPWLLLSAASAHDLTMGNSRN